MDLKATCPTDVAFCADDRRGCIMLGALGLSTASMNMQSEVYHTLSPGSNHQQHHFHHKFWTLHLHSHSIKCLNLGHTQAYGQLQYIISTLHFHYKTQVYSLSLLQTLLYHCNRLRTTNMYTAKRLVGLPMINKAYLQQLLQQPFYRQAYWYCRSQYCLDCTGQTGALSVHRFRIHQTHDSVQRM